MSVEVNLFRLSDYDSRPEPIGPVNFKQEGSLLEFRKFLEDACIVYWPFDFWYRDDSLRIPRKLEALNSVETDVFLIDESSPKRRRIEAVDDNLIPCQDVTTVEPDISDASRVSSVVTDAREVNHLKSVLVSKETMKKYKEHEKKLRKELALISLDDHMWRLCSWDFRGVGYVKLFCEECHKECGGQSGIHTNSAIQNLFRVFKSSHLKSNSHIRNWCRRNKLSFTDYPQLILTAADHKSLVEEGLEVMKSVNGPFVRIGDESLRSFLCKVKCELCGELFQLCPPKKNLAANLNHHLLVKHSKLNSERAGGNNKKGVQKDLHSWFRYTGIKSRWTDEATSRFRYDMGGQVL